MVQPWSGVMCCVVLSCTVLYCTVNTTDHKQKELCRTCTGELGHLALLDSSSGHWSPAIGQKVLAGFATAHVVVPSAGWLVDFVLVLDWPFSLLCQCFAVGRDSLSLLLFSSFPA
jgi:hypothetical protein